MAEKKSPTKTGFSAEERAAMKERAKELKAEETRAESAKSVLAKIGEMKEPDRSIATRLHELVLETAPDVLSKLWYGMPSYSRDGKIVCFFQSAEKFETRYSTFGFNDSANLDDGNVWPVAFAVAQLTKADEKVILARIEQAFS
jgi:uncharacterized protein YdhG (YjbR/CyaY superfamily)